VLLAIDPGTKNMGVALFDQTEPEGKDLVKYGLIVAPNRERAPARIIAVLAELDRWAAGHPINVVACEAAGGYGWPVADSLGMLVIELGHWARKRKAEWHRYNPSTIRRHLGPRRGMGVKQAVASVITALYGIDAPEPQDDVTDAIAVGYVHLREMRLRAVLEAADAEGLR